MQYYSWLFGIVTLFLFFPFSTWAADENRPITLIVPFGEGGSTDLPARLLAEVLQKKLQQPVQVRNVTGASGVDGAAYAASAKPDGYTLLYAPSGVMLLQPLLTMVPYNVHSFSYIGNVMRTPIVLMSHSTAPWKTFHEMVTLVRQSPATYRVGITGTNNMTHLPVQDLAKHYGLDLQVMRYRNSQEVINDMRTGYIQLYADVPVFLSQKDIVGLAQFAAKPAAGITLPTTASLGYSNEMTHWQGVFAPKGLPPEILERLSTALQEACADYGFIAGARNMSMEVDWMGPVAFKNFVQQEFTAYATRFSRKTDR